MDHLASAYSRYLADSDADAFLSAIASHGGVAPDSKLDCPVAHRIRDVSLNGNDYRVVRVYDVATRSTKLFVYPTDAAGTQDGVPYELAGDGLHQWVLDELAEPTDDPTDWARYLAMER